MSVLQNFLSIQPHCAQPCPNDLPHPVIADVPSPPHHRPHHAPAPVRAAAAAAAASCCTCCRPPPPSGWWCRRPPRVCPHHLASACRPRPAPRSGSGAGRRRRVPGRRPPRATARPSRRGGRRLARAAAESRAGGPALPRRLSAVGRTPRRPRAAPLQQPAPAASSGSGPCWSG